MRSLYMLIVLAAVFLLLSACNTNDSSKSETKGNGPDSEKTAQNDQHSTSENGEADKSEQGKDQHSDKSHGDADKQTSKGKKDAEDKDAERSDMTQKQVLQAIKDQLDTNLDKRLPASLPLEKGKHLSAATKSDADSYRVIFFASDKPIPIDNKALNDKEQATEIARLQVKKMA
ncbi:hypothetical protein RWE15_12905 [Virgibacillus halophilus]|uniref:Sporulation lipoprotein YhcN/YlaJ (Spore_YhcN_YlaJ) n=1 Tax=Tigheibacillus halophilus TaxID=361280 RepID=A0ABU5C761_9BACI|nr:hypothetical protein [Virgibacillus halophilus]